MDVEMLKILWEIRDLKESMEIESSLNRNRLVTPCLTYSELKEFIDKVERVMTESKNKEIKR